MALAELLEQLREVDEVLLLELMQITSTELVDAFIEKIEDNEERIRQYLSDNT